MNAPRYDAGPRTERLQMRAMSVDDAEAAFAFNSDPEVMRYTCEELWTSVEQARAFLAAYPDFDTVGYGRWAVVHREDARVIGFCGLKYLEDLNEVDVGYRLLPAYWGRGLATEAVRATLDFGFETIGLARIIALVVPENLASRRVLEKCGLTLEGEIEYDGVAALRYVIEALS